MRSTLLSVLLALAANLAYAQTGTVRGTLKDAITKEDLIGATVRVDGTAIGAATDVNGFFSISKVPAGTVKLILTYVSYRTKEIPGVRVEDGKVTEINTAMEEDKVQLAEVKVVASRSTNTEISVISEIKAAQQIVSGISAQQIARTLDRDAGQVVKRVPGITIVGDRFINIRGLSSRYNTVMLHNAFTPSTETDVRAFSFDVIPSSQIDRLLIFKTPSADNPGEFAGGIVKIFTKSIPDQTSVTVDYGVAFRAGTTFSNFLQSDQANFATGFNNGAYDLPKNFPSNINNIINNTALVTQAGQSLQNDWSASSARAIPDQRAAITASFRIDAGKVRIGNITAVNYSYNFTNFGISRNDYDVDGNGTSSALFTFNDQQYTRNVRIGLMHNWAARFGEGRHLIELKNLYNQFSTGQYVDRTGRDIQAAYNAKNGSFNQVFRGIYTGQLVGRHDLGANRRTTIDWVAGYNTAFRDQPDYRRYRSDLNGSQTTLYVPFGAAATFFLGRFYGKLNESAITGSANLTHKFVFGTDKRELEVKAGVFYEKKDRDFAGRNLGYVRSSSSDFNNQLLNGTIANLFQTQNINASTGIKIDEQTNPSDSYTAKNTLLAYYVSANIPLTKKFNAIVGLRVEDNTQSLNSRELNGTPVTVNYPITTALPSVNLTYNFTERSLLRAAYGRTINRPEFRELAPFAFYDFDYNFVYRGNPLVVPATINNFDLRYEFYPTPAELVSVAAFYKNFTDPIESVAIIGPSGRNFSFQNAKSAYTAGIEIEVRKGLGTLFPQSKVLQKMSLLFNTALIASKITLAENNSTQFQSNNRPLQGQSPYIINIGLNYNDPSRDLQLNLLYNVIGKRIVFVGLRDYPDFYEMPRNVLDLTFSKGLGKKWQVKGGVTDILNQPILWLQDGNGDNKLNRTKDLTIQKYSPGQLVQLGFSYTIL
jgi:TonB-dependent receptor